MITIQQSRMEGVYTPVYTFKLHADMAEGVMSFVLTDSQDKLLAAWLSPVGRSEPEYCRIAFGMGEIKDPIEFNKIIAGMVKSARMAF